MSRKTGNLEVKKLNRNRIYRYMNETNQCSMSEISVALSLSGPTVLSVVNELKDEGLVREAGEFDSTGGRKAKAFETVKDAVFSIGVDLTKHHVGLAYTDLSRKSLEYIRIRKPFEDTEKYFGEVQNLIHTFIKDNRIPEGKIIGMGLSVPGIVNRDKKQLPKSHVLDVLSIPGEKWLNYMPYNCVMLNDANAAAIAECHDIDKSGGLVYLALSNSVGGAIVFDADKNQIVDEHIYVGDNWRSGEFGHMVIHPHGKKCYCGKEGCLDSYCSAYRLADLEDGKLEVFFEKLEAGSEKHQKVWNEYLENLAIAIDNLRVCFDCDIVLGGYVGGFMEPYMKQLRELVSQRDIFEKDGRYVKAGRLKKEASALGAAIFQIDRYIAQI